MRAILLMTLCCSFFIISCNDGIHGTCFSMKDEYCQGVYECISGAGNLYVKVGDDRYYCDTDREDDGYSGCYDAYSRAVSYCYSKAYEEEQENAEDDYDSLHDTTDDTYGEWNGICYYTDRKTGEKRCVPDLTRKACEEKGYTYTTFPVMDCNIEL